VYFAKHESFYIRDGWLYKGLKAVASKPDIFVSADATDRLGLGKNMVRALRYWMQATGLAEERWENRVRTQYLTDLGELILQSDPYFELEGTLWLIQHQLISSESLATAWYWFFNHYVPVQFTREEFIDRLSQWANTQKADSEASIAEGSLRKDFDCLIHTYLAEEDKKKSPEDQIVSPLTSLGLLTDFRERDEDDNKVHRYRLIGGNVTNIPSLIFLHVLLKSQETKRPDANQVGLHQVLREPVNVGRTFNIGMMALEELAARLEDDHPNLKIRLTRTGGLDQITLPTISAREVMEQYYGAQVAAEGMHQ
jgi:hypothetical protein